MADSKYGRLFTEEDTKELVMSAVHAGIELGEDSDDPRGFNGEAIWEALVSGIQPKFPEDEPLFLLRGQDKRAAGAVRWYADHQSPRASVAHLEGTENALDAFTLFRQEHPDRMKDPD